MARVGAFGMALVAVGVAALVPLDWVAGLPVLCPFRLLTGLPCPGCGMTRSLVSLAHGDLIGSLFFHPLGPALAIVVTLAIVGRLDVADRRALLVGRTFARRLQVGSGPLVWAAVAAVVAVWLVRLPLFLSGHWIF
jgi:Protein of unknown function (DUF2752)